MFLEVVIHENYKIRLKINYNLLSLFLQKCVIICNERDSDNMNSEQKIIAKMKNNNGVITTNEVKKMGIERRILSRLVEKKIIERENHGLYILKGELGDEYYSLVYNIPQAVFSHTTALYFHNLVDRVPLTYDITVSKDYRGRLEHDKSVNLYKVNKDILELGKVKIKSPQGQEVFVYDIERCLCDLIKNRNNIDF